MIHRSVQHENNPFEKRLDLSPKNGFKLFVGTGTLLEVINAQYGQMVIVQQAYMNRAEAFDKVVSSLNKLTGIRPAAMKLFRYLVVHMDPALTEVFFNPHNYAESENVSVRYVYRLVQELIEKGILARSLKKFVYFMNCNVVVNPGRIMIIKEFIITDEFPEEVTAPFPAPDKSGW